MRKKHGGSGREGKGGLRLQLWIVDLMGFDGEVMQILVIQKGPALN